MLIVGGTVLDLLNGEKPRDYDLEVYGITFNDLQKLLKENDYQIKSVGLAYGILTIKDDELDIDIGLPRKEKSVGPKHTDFTVELDQSMSYEEAFRRRDFTINAIGYDPIKSEIVDPYNGRHDFINGVLRMVDRKTFIEDPLRPIRAIQIYARKAEKIDEETLAVCRSMKSKINLLPKERIFDELSKLLLKAEKPSKGIRLLDEMNYLDIFTEIHLLKYISQNPEHHPEGDVFTHTMDVLDRAAKLKIYSSDHLAFMFAALLHDTGKITNTDPVKLTAYGHAKESARLAENFMYRITRDKRLINKVVNLCRYHMHLFHAERSNKLTPYRRLYNKSHLRDLIYFVKADHPDFLIERLFEIEKNINNETDGEESIPALVTGYDIMERGITKGKEIGNIKEECYRYQINNDIQDKYIMLKYLDNLLKKLP